MESKEELSSASYEESIINKISKGMTSLARKRCNQERYEKKNINKRITKWRFEIINKSYLVKSYQRLSERWNKRWTWSERNTKVIERNAFERRAVLK